MSIRCRSRHTIPRDWRCSLRRSWSQPRGTATESANPTYSPGTSHLVAADRHGMVISLTSTVNTGFGSQLMVPESGIILNNEMNDFSIPGTRNAFGFEPSPNNFIRPGKRPQSSMCPVIVEDAETGKPYLALGGQGGSRIISSVAQVLWYMLDWGQSCSSAVEGPRFHDQLQPNQVCIYLRCPCHGEIWVADGFDGHRYPSHGHTITLRWPSWRQGPTMLLGYVE